MKLHHFKTDFTTQLSEIYPQTEIDTFFFYLMESYLDLQRIDLLMQPDFKISEEKHVLLKDALKRLQHQEPIQYILGNTEFYGFPFLVNKNTLIPRPETEELVEWILDEVQNLKTVSSISDFSILEIGTGTGCIPISLKKHLADFDISAIDVSEEALKTAQENAKINNVEIQFIKQDILKTDNLNFINAKINDAKITFDIIISNPPYVRELEKAEINKNVLENEPHLALFVTDENPLIFYDKIADLAKKHLSKNGILFFEINQYLGKETLEMLSEKGFKNIELKKDFQGNDRMIKASII
ncbi:peptide chain release factor N(5)-glutamine methyltransferase [Tenacibaculum piscium]|uniref:peptide chain release factor N(5)-glutamine methyltransferase n=1 Tax=Tenacibaculum piscium TaxID=1458515 RepID=UPI001F34F22D|nr:peptide chain release factor N(5)-glutamine methyltransferase [Tenacibaculum piscium]